MADININKVTQGIAKIIEDGEITKEEAGNLFSLVKESAMLLNKQDEAEAEFYYNAQEQDGFVRTVNKELLLLGSDVRLKVLEFLKDKDDNKKLYSLPDGGFDVAVGFIVGSPTQQCLPFESFNVFFQKDGSYATMSRFTKIFAKGDPDGCWF